MFFIIYSYFYFFNYFLQTSCQCTGQSECICPANNIGTPYCSVNIPTFPLVGCTDPIALNFDINANINDNSCYYNFTDFTEYNYTVSTTGVTTISSTTQSEATSNGVVTGSTTGGSGVTTISTGVTTISNPDEINEDSNSENGMAIGAIIGIVVGVLACLAIVAIIAIIALRRKNKSKSNDNENPDNSVSL